ncbi:PD-(D/E)XK nuclease family protein [Leucobacter japonicus]|uniref:PD-(D/E)XK nuclease family protein n=1 Tax=Leucobacter japonicus TaxID=1461259 RepID=UPI0006A7BB23|nr:PD-(D/E)XK nuclease family protein [Leucobacter japonicus]
MTEFDPSQVRARDLVTLLEPGQHARVLGAPGSGKTLVLVEAFRQAREREGWGEGDVLAIAPNRLVAADLRARVERRIGRALGGTPVRTAASFGFAVLAREHAIAGTEAPRLLTGTVHDEVIAEVIAAVDAPAAAAAAGLIPEVLATAPFRAELRDLGRVLDDYGLQASELLAALDGAAASDSAYSLAPDAELASRWRVAARLIDAVEHRLRSTRAGESSASALLRAAGAAIRAHGVRSDAHASGQAFAVPRLILVDDAQELGEGPLALLAACAEAGSSIVVFGDPDIATGAFQGERAGVLAGVDAALARRIPSEQLRSRAAAGVPKEVCVALDRVHRQHATLRGFVRSLTDRIGAAGAGAQRAAEAASPEMTPSAVSPDAADAAAATHAVQFARAESPAEQLGIIAHRLRARHLGLDGVPAVDWNDMAVICRSRGEAMRVARALAVHQVPTGIASGGLVLREHRVVRELVELLQHALGLRSLTADEIMRLAGGVIGGLDPVAVRRLRGALLLQERRDAAAESRAPESIDALVLDAFAFPGATPLVDSAGGRTLRRLGLIAQAAARVREAGGTARETLWAVWDGTRLAPKWQADALDARGARADDAHRSLDAVMGLFYTLQRHEESASAQPVDALLSDVLESTVPEDSLAQRSQRAAVTVTTPQGAIGREFSIVAVVGVQDGAWPNLRSRGSLLGTAALERWLRGAAATAPSRRDTMHDELRLFAHSCARARSELLVVAIGDEQQHPSAFFGLGREHAVVGLPSTRLTLRGQVAAMRRRVVTDAGDTEAQSTLVALARAEVPGAHPDDWYGVRPPSTSAPLTDLEADPDATVGVSPSQLERAETCPLDWAVSSLGGGSGSVQASLGTLLHHAFETATEPEPDALLEIVQQEWAKLPFVAPWESERTERLARAMTAGLAAYLQEFTTSDRELIGTEAAFKVRIDRAELRGIADRLERRETADGTEEVTVLDLKTGRTPPSGPASEQHAQLQAYQLGVLLGAFETGVARSGGARLLYVHPDAAKQKGFIERVQQPLTDEAREAFAERVSSVARVMAGGSFTARIEHHCSDPHQPGNCRLHVIPAVSRA